MRGYDQRGCDVKIGDGWWVDSLYRKLAATKGQTMSEETQHWSVAVGRNGENVLTIESNCLSGRDLSAEDERVIRMAAQHLQSFIGAASPPRGEAFGVDDPHGLSEPANPKEQALAASSTPREAQLREAGGWQPIVSAPKDGTLVWVYAAEREGLPAFQTWCAYDPDAGWCVDELREVTHWMPSPVARTDAPEQEQP